MMADSIETNKHTIFMRHHEVTGEEALVGDFAGAYPVEVKEAMNKYGGVGLPTIADKKVADRYQIIERRKSDGKEREAHAFHTEDAMQDAFGKLRVSVEAHEALLASDPRKAN